MNSNGCNFKPSACMSFQLFFITFSDPCTISKFNNLHKFNISVSFTLDSDIGHTLRLVLYYCEYVCSTDGTDFSKWKRTTFLPMWYYHKSHGPEMSQELDHSTCDGIFLLVRGPFQNCLCLDTKNVFVKIGSSCK